MDDLDRLFFELVEILRRERPTGLREPLSVQEMHQALIPYRRIRDPAGLRSHDHYEATLSRLLAGERQYIIADVELQERLQQGLEEPLPDIQRYRAHDQARVQLNPEKIPPPGDTRYAPPDVREDARRLEEASPASEPDDGDEPEAMAPEARPDTALGPPEPDPERGVGSEETSAVPDPPPPELRSESREVEVDTCPHCQGGLPEAALFCPHCGMQLRASTCGGCGAEIQPGWAYCARCGARVQGGANSS